MPENVVFDEPKRSTERFTTTVPSRLGSWLVKYSQGYIRNEKQAEAILVIVSILTVLISLYYIFAGGGPDLPRGIDNVPLNGIPIN